MNKIQYSGVFLIFLELVLAEPIDDIPCIPLAKNDSIVCVCNSTYCDTITREIPAPGYYVTYTSSKSGLRFSKNRGVIQQDQECDSQYSKVFNLHPETTYQTVEGFGGAVTDSAGINWKSLSALAQQNLINSYCSKDGLEYNMLRVPCGSTDFSTRFWAYNEFPAYDTDFTNFTLSLEDELYRVPMIQACMEAATDEVEIIGATWSPPTWMLTKEWPTGYNTLSEDYNQAYATYHCLFAELMQEYGIKVWGMSIGNEPLTSLLGGPKQEFLSWNGTQMIHFLADYFAPTMRKCSVEDIKLLAVDDQRYALPLWMILGSISAPIDYIILSANHGAGKNSQNYLLGDEEVSSGKLYDLIMNEEINKLTKIEETKKDIMKDIDGIALHYYVDKLTAPGTILRSFSEKYSDKFVINTESCTGSKLTEFPKVNLGSWSRAKEYISDILEDLNYNIVGWVDWNMCLDKKGGPTWLENYVDSPIIVDAEKDEFYKQPMFYAFGHFTKFIPRGSKRISVLTKSLFSFKEDQINEFEKLGQSYFTNVAFLTPQDTIVVVIYNDGYSQDVLLKTNGQEVPLTLEADSITTVELSPTCQEKEYIYLD